MNHVFDGVNKRMERLCRAFPSKLRPAPKPGLKEMPRMEDYCPPGVLLYICLPKWNRAINKAMRHNEKILGIKP